MCERNARDEPPDDAEQYIYLDSNYETCTSPRRPLNAPIFASSSTMPVTQTEDKITLKNYWVSTT